MRISIKHKLSVSFLIVSILFIILSYYSYKSTKETVETYDYLIETVTELRSISEQIKTNAARQISYLRGYFVYSTPSFKNRFNGASSNINTFVDKGVEISADGDIEKRLTELAALNKELTHKGNALMNSNSPSQSALDEVTALSDTLSDQADILNNLLTNDILKPEIENAQRESEQRMFLVVIFSAIVTAISLTIGFIQSSLITKPIQKLQTNMQKVAKGDLHTAKFSIKAKDEIYHLNEAFEQMKDNLSKMISNMSESSNMVAASAEQLHASAEQSSNASTTIASSIQSIAESNEHTLGKISDNALALDSILSGVEAIKDRSHYVSSLSQVAFTNAEQGTTQMEFIYDSVQRSNSIIASLADRSNEIGKMIELISNIANQTNLLALNAAIEATRAGENGKGFAVVADEVRKLAEQSQASTQDISQSLQGIQQDTSEAVTMLNETLDRAKTGVSISTNTVESFSTIVTNTQKVAPAIEEVAQTVATITTQIKDVVRVANEIALLSKENGSSTEEVAASTEEQMASMEEIKASAESLSSMAEELMEIVSQFNQKEEI